jgi:pyruvate dehydrogenase E2 component (dihydrolipoamide acetyltransferase)
MHEVKMPKMGQSVEEAAITQWHKQEGDEIKEGELLFSIQTDKAEVECESTATGVLRKILLAPDIEVPVLTPVALVGTADEPLPDLSAYGTGGGPAPAAEKAAVPAEDEAAPVEDAAPVAAEPEAQPEVSVADFPAQPAEQAISPRASKRAEELGVDPAFVTGTGPGGRVIETDIVARAEQLKDVKISPAARKLAEQKGVNIATLQGTGSHGKITKDDVLKAAPSPPAAPAVPAAASAPLAAGQVRRVPLTPMRRIIADRMAESFYSAPHYYVTVEVEMTAGADFRATLQTFKPSYSDLLSYAVAKALREYPAVNARWAEDAIEEVGDVNLGLAVALPTGLIVPVIRQVQNKSLEGIHHESRALIDKARNGKLLPDDYLGNTFTISNLGVFGVDHFTAIINQPDSAILAVGTIKEKPVAIDGGIYVRPMMNLTLSSDHRVVDGAIAAQFMGRLKEILENGEF